MLDVDQLSVLLCSAVPTRLQRVSQRAKGTTPVGEITYRVLQTSTQLYYEEVNNPFQPMNKPTDGEEQRNKHLLRLHYIHPDNRLWERLQTTRRVETEHASPHTARCSFSK